MNDHKFKIAYRNMQECLESLDTLPLSDSELEYREALIRGAIELVDRTCGNYGRGQIVVHQGYRAERRAIA